MRGNKVKSGVGDFGGWKLVVNFEVGSWKDAEVWVLAHYNSEEDQFLLSSGALHYKLFLIVLVK